jgi:GR25 family glycosyltransferase involved in LPS biosynthesis
MSLIENVLLMVLGTQGTLRSRELERYAAEFRNCVFIDPVHVNKSDRDQNLVNEKLTKLLIGRTLSDPELGCALAHRNARRTAEALLRNAVEIEWVIFAEDDASLDLQGFRNILADLESISKSVPSLVSFYSAERCKSEQHNGKTEKITTNTRLSESRHWRAGAVCYALNRRAINDLYLFNDLPIDHVADWPVYFSRIRLYISNHTCICEVGGNSRIGVRVNQGIGARFVMHALQIFHLRKLSKLYVLPARKIFWHLVLTPIFLDGKNRLTSGINRIKLLRN